MKIFIPFSIKSTKFLLHHTAMKNSFHFHDRETSAHLYTRINAAAGRNKSEVSSAQREGSSSSIQSVYTYITRAVRAREAISVHSLGVKQGVASEQASRERERGGRRKDKIKKKRSLLFACSSSSSATLRPGDLLLSSVINRS